MGSGYAAHWADVMEWDDIKRIVPNEAAALEQQLQAAGVGMDDFCLANSIDDWDEVQFAVETDDGINQAISQINAEVQTEVELDGMKIMDAYEKYGVEKKKPPKEFPRPAPAHHRRGELGGARMPATCPHRSVGCTAGHSW
jgi:hypothetical protein